MIAHLNGDFETVDYSQSRSVLLYDNIEHEEYPIHWHNAIEIIMPLTVVFYICNECISLIENAGRIGVPVSKKLLDVLEQLKNKDE